MTRLRIGIIGASGYSGIELTRILAQHPHVELALLTSDRWQGLTAAAKLGLSGPAASLEYQSPPTPALLTRADGSNRHWSTCDVIFLATSVEVSLALIPSLVEEIATVIDLSGAFRFPTAELFARAYGQPHSAPALLPTAVYGLPELDRKGLRGARLVANPGCYATAGALALAPLVSDDLCLPDSLVIDAASGVTGAGRKGTEELSFAEVDGDFRAYRVLRHQHTPEIAQTLSRLSPAVRSSGQSLRPSFTAHLLPLRRGILATAHARLRPSIGEEAVRAAFVHNYADEPFVRLLPTPDDVGLKQVLGSNRCHLSFAVDHDEAIVVASLDNLVKGAAGQAVQNLNAVMGWPETTGLDELRGFYP